MAVPMWVGVALAVGLVAGGAATATIVATTSGPFTDADSASDEQSARSTPAPVVQEALVETITGGPDSEGPTEEGPPGVARFGAPVGIALGPDGSLYVADFNNHVVLRIDSSAVTTRVAGSGVQGVKDGSATEAEFFGPQGVAVADDGTIYVADGYGNRVRKIAKDGQVSTVAGGGDFGLGKGDFRDGIGDAARFDGVSAIQIDQEGDLVVADYANHRIRRVSLTGEVTTIAGTGTYGHRDGPASQSMFAHPSALAIGPDGTIWIAEHGNNDVRAMATTGVVRTALARTTPLTPEATVSYPSGIGVDKSGVVYVADTQGHRVVRLDADGRVELIAGSGTRGFADGTAGSAAFRSPTAVAFDSQGQIVVTDRENAAIRRIRLP